MPRSKLLIVGLGLVLTTGCGPSKKSKTPSSTNPNSSPLIGTWDVTTTPSGEGVTQSVVVIGQDQLSITSPSFTYTFVRTGNVLKGTDITGTVPGSNAVINSTQTPSTFDTGMLPFNLGGTWAIQGGAQGATPTVTCSLNIASGSIGATCSDSSGPSPFNFTFTTVLNQAASSTLGAFGGTWTNTWTWNPSGPTNTCDLTFGNNTISTCTTGNSVLANISFTLNGNVASGNAQGTEFSATRR